MSDAKFSFKVNKYNDLCLRDIPNDMWRFAELLDQALGEANLRHCPIIWLFLSEKQGDLIPIALREDYRFHAVVSSGVLRMCRQVHGGSDQVPSIVPHAVHVEGIVVHFEKGWSEPHFLCRKHHVYKKNRLPSVSPDRHEFLCHAITRHLQTLNVSTEVVGMLGVWENRFGANNLVSLHFGYLLRLGPEQNSRVVDSKLAEWVPISSAKELFANRYEAEWFTCAPILKDRIHPRTTSLRNWMAHLTPDPEDRGIEQFVEVRDTREMKNIVPTLDEWMNMSDVSRDMLQEKLDKIQENNFSTFEACQEIRNKKK